MTDMNDHGIASDFLLQISSDELVSKILDLSSDLICIAGTDGYFKFLNKAWENTLGYAREELFADPFLKFIHPEDHAKNNQEVTQLQKGHPAFDFENRYLHKDGSIIYLSWTATPIGEGNIFFCIGRNMTDQKKHQEKLKESEERFRVAFDEASIGRCMTAIDGHFLRTNSTLCQMLGYSADELSHLTFNDITHPDDREASQECIRALVNGETTSYRFEKRYIHKNGTPVFVEVNATLLRDRKRNPLYCLTEIIDLTPRKSFELCQLEAARRWQATFDAVTDAIFILDKEQHIHQANMAARKLFGITESELASKHCWQIVHGTDGPPEGCPFPRVRQSLHPEVMELPFKDRWYSVRVDPMLDAQGQFNGGVHVVSDITARKRAQEELFHSIQRLESLNSILQYRAENMQDLLDYALSEAIRITNSTIGYFYYYDETTKNFTLNSWSKEVMSRCRIAEPQVTYHLDKTGIWGEAVRQRQAIMVNDFQKENPLKKGYPEGHVLLSRFLTVPVFQTGKIVAVVGVANKQEEYSQSDTLQLSLLMETVWKIVEQGKAVEEKAILEEQFRQAQKVEAIGLLAGGVAHDFNNMLCIILGYSQNVFNALPADSPLKKDVHEIIEAGNRSADLTRQLLAFSRKQKMQPELFDLNDRLQKLKKMLHRLIGEDILIDMYLDEKENIVLADPGQIEQVIMNLVTNARDAMPMGGRLAIETSQVRLDDQYVFRHPGVNPGLYVRLTISDSGVGMNKETLSHIFEPFFTTKAQGKGTGLGLATVYGIVKQSGGNIWAYSEPGQGTTFKIYFPLAGKEACSSAPEKSPDQGNKHLSRHILVVEDEEGLRKLIKATLERQGFLVTVANDGNQALHLLLHENIYPDIILTDIVMPGISGPNMIEHLNARGLKVKVLFMSGYTDHSLVGGIINEPGHFFIQKPFSPTALRNKIEEVLAAA